MRVIIASAGSRNSARVKAPGVSERHAHSRFRPDKHHKGEDLTEWPEALQVREFSVLKV